MSEINVSGLLSAHLKDRFLNLLNRIKEDGPSNVPHISRFESIKTNILCSHYFWFDINSVPSVSNVLRDLIDALSECRAFAYQRDEALEKSHLLGFVSPSVVLFKRKMKSRLLQDVEKLTSARKNSNWLAASSNSSREFEIETNPDKGASEIIGFDKIARKVENFLINDNPEVNEDGFRAIAIVGSGGSGKTALAQKLYNGMRRNFDIRIWLRLTESSLWEEHVVEDMLKQVGFNYNAWRAELDIVELLKELNNILKGKSYLIVFDDAQGTKDWYSDLSFKLPEGGTFENKLSHALPKGSGGTVIVTTRMESEAEKMVGRRNVFRLDSVSDELCWSIFEQTLNEKGIARNELQHVQKMKSDIIQNCNGLPLVAKALAEIIYVRRRELK